MSPKPIILSAAFLLAIASCKSREEEWIDGNTNGAYRDTVTNGQHYRHYGGFWYPVVGGLIAPSLYRGATYSDINRPGFRPTRAATAGRTRSGGFGTSGRTTFGS